MAREVLYELWSSAGLEGIGIELRGGIGWWCFEVSGEPLVAEGVYPDAECFCKTSPLKRWKRFQGGENCRPDILLLDVELHPRRFVVAGVDHFHGLRRLFRLYILNSYFSQCYRYCFFLIVNYASMGS